MRRPMLVLVLAVLPLALASAAGAQGADRDALRKACRQDFQKLCASVQPGGGRVVQCLRDHDKELAPACREALASARR